MHWGALFLLVRAPRARASQSGARTNSQKNKNEINAPGPAERCPAAVSARGSAAEHRPQQRASSLRSRDVTHTGTTRQIDSSRRPCAPSDTFPHTHRHAHTHTPPAPFAVRRHARQTHTNKCRPPQRLPLKTSGWVSNHGRGHVAKDCPHCCALACPHCCDNGLVNGQSL